MKICCTAEQFLPCSRRTFAARRTELCCTADFKEQPAGENSEKAETGRGKSEKKQIRVEILRKK